MGNLAFDAAAWANVKSEEVEQYLTWLKEQHYSAPSITNLPIQSASTHVSLLNIDFFHRQNIKISEKSKSLQTKRDNSGLGKEKSTPLAISNTQAQLLLTQPATRRGQTDALIMSLFLRCGLWPREVATLNRHSLNIEKGTLTFYDHNAEEEQTILLDPQTLEIANAYLRDYSPYGALFVGNRKEGEKQQRLTDRALNTRVRTLGERVGLPTLLPDDCHIYWEQQRERSQQKQQVQQNPTRWAKNTATAHIHDETATTLYQPLLLQPEAVVTERPSRRKSLPRHLELSFL